MPATLFLLVACGEHVAPPLSQVTALDCPAPGALPFRLASHSFVTANNAALARDSPRNKDEASDTVGNPGGLAASTYANENEQPNAEISYRGVKARTTADAGFSAAPLAHEYVSLWQYNGPHAAWHSIGRVQTADNGAYQLNGGGAVAENGQAIYAVLEADGSCSEHFDFLVAPGTNVVVTDIDGTLTTSDAELVRQLSDGSYTPAMMKAAAPLMQAWAAKGYLVVYLTARLHLFRSETRQWLRELRFPPGPVITSGGTLDAGPYKAVWLHRMIDRFGWVVVAAYGNADSDIAAYQDAAIAKSRTFMIGEAAGRSGTVAISDNDFTQHLMTFVAAQPSQR
jgi:hypothetical protein